MCSEAELQDFLVDGSAALQRYAHVLTGDPYRAQDLAQETLVRVCEARRRVEAHMLPAYARRVMFNLNVSWWRRVTSRETPLPEGPAALGTHPDGSDERAVRADVLAALRRLPVRTRTALVLHYYEDRPARQIAEILDCSETNVHTMLSRGRAALRDALAPVPATRSRA